VFAAEIAPCSAPSARSADLAAFCSESLAFWADLSASV